MSRKRKITVTPSNIDQIAGRIRKFISLSDSKYINNNKLYCSSNNISINKIDENIYGLEVKYNNYYLIFPGCNIYLDSNVLIITNYCNPTIKIRRVDYIEVLIHIPHCPKNAMEIVKDIIKNDYI